MATNAPMYPLMPRDLVGLRVVAVHAHPDDESIWTGGVLYDLASRGADVTVITCTLGEEGEVIGTEYYQQLVADQADQLGGYRIGELAAAVELLGVRHEFLAAPGAFRDSGMVGSPAHENPRAFVRCTSEAQEALDEALHRLAPDLILTYGPDGGYGHPDHIQAHRLVHASSFQPQRIVWAVTLKQMIDSGCAAITAPSGWRNAPEEIATVERADIAHAFGPQALAAKVAAMRAHATQVWVADGAPHPLLGSVAHAEVSDMQAAPVVWALSNLIAQPLVAVEHYQVGAGRPVPEGATDVTAGLEGARR